MLNPSQIALEIDEEIKSRDIPTLQSISPHAHGVMVVIIESHVRKAFAAYLKEQKDKDENTAKMQEAAKKGFGDLGTPGPNG